MLKALGKTPMKPFQQTNGRFFTSFKSSTNTENMAKAFRENKAYCEEILRKIDDHNTSISEEAIDLAEKLGIMVHGGFSVFFPQSQAEAFRSIAKAQSQLKKGK